MKGNPQPYTFNVERDVMDTLLIRHAHEKGAKVLQGVKVRRGALRGRPGRRGAGAVADGWERDLYARVVVDASGRRCLLANQLKMKQQGPRASTSSASTPGSGT